MKKLLEIKELHAQAADKEILKGLNLTINPGEVHVIMGPNGAGKSTLANVILNNPQYIKTSGEVILDGENINELPTNEIAKKGIFMSFQSPEEIPGISTFNFLTLTIFSKYPLTSLPKRLWNISSCFCIICSLYCSAFSSYDCIS